MSTDAISPALQQHYAAQDAMTKRYTQAEASLDPADVIAVAIDRLNSDDSPLLDVVHIFQSGRSLTQMELIGLGKCINDLIAVAAADLTEQKLSTGWFIERED